MAPVTILFVTYLLVLGAESQQHYNYPAKNINLDSGSTTFSSYYSLQAPGCCSAFSSSHVDDFQAVAGIELAAGGYLLVGRPNQILLPTNAAGTKLKGLR